MSKDYRREKEDFDNSDWMYSDSDAPHKSKRMNDIERRKRDSKKLSRERDRQSQYH